MAQDRLRRISSATLIALAACAPADAAAPYEHSSGWQLVQGVDSCTITMDFAGPGATRLILVQYISGDVSVLTDNTQWRATDGTNYTVRYELNGKSYGGADAIGTTDSSRKGFFSRFGTEFSSDFAKAASLRISVDDQVVGQLSLAGAAAAMTSMEHCLAAIRSRLASEARDKLSGLDLPVGSAASMTATPTTASFPPKPPTPIGFVLNWASTKNRASRVPHGKGAVTTGYILTIGRDGTATGCQVTTSSGYADLDAATCDLVRREARFNPATNTAGQPTDGTWSGDMHWITP